MYTAYSGDYFAICHSRSETSASAFRMYTTLASLASLGAAESRVEDVGSVFCSIVKVKGDLDRLGRVLVLRRLNKNEARPPPAPLCCACW